MTDGKSKRLTSTIGPIKQGLGASGARGKAKSADAGGKDSN